MLKYLYWLPTPLRMKSLFLTLPKRPSINATYTSLQPYFQSPFSLLTTFHSYLFAFSSWNMPNASQYRVFCAGFHSEMLFLWILVWSSLSGHSGVSLCVYLPQREQSWLFGSFSISSPCFLFCASSAISCFICLVYILLSRMWSSISAEASGFLFTTVF